MHAPGTTYRLQALLLGAAALIAAANWVHAQDDKSGVTPNTISLPSGPGSIEGLGEAFQPTLNTGTAKYGVPLTVPPGTAGHTPSLGLSYEGGGGNGVLGFGWSLPLPMIERQSDKGIPEYNGNDNFINEMSEELVPRNDGFFFCENEGAFIRYRRAGSGWEGTLPDGTLLEFGLTSQSRVTNPDSGDTYRWYLERSTDTNGNVIEYRYTTFSGNENLNQKYLSEIRYGPGAPDWDNFHFVLFAYETRPDWFEDCRGGFPVRTGRRIRGIFVATQGPDLGGFVHASGDFNGDGDGDYLNRHYRLEYDTDPHWSLLSEIVPTGADGASELPSSTFGYTQCSTASSFSASGKIIGSTNTPAQVMDSPNVDLIDMNGDGLPDILQTVDGLNHRAFLNRGEQDGATVWSDPVEVGGSGQAKAVRLENDGAQLSDITGDGVADLVFDPGDAEVYYYPNNKDLTWGSRTLMDDALNVPSPFGGDGSVKTADVDFDKRIDIIQSTDSVYRVWFNRGGSRYEQQSVPYTDGFDFSQSGVGLSDFNGDRVPDIVRIRPAELQVTPGLGHGRFGSLRSVPLSDFLSDADLEKAQLQDVTGDGNSDLVLEVSGNQLHIWENLGNYRLGPRKIITGLPARQGLDSTTRWADINGNGTTDYIFVDSDTSPAIQTVDIGALMGCVPGTNLLSHIDNGIGRQIAIEYDTSTRYMLADLAELNDPDAVRPWPEALPFPVQVVSRVTVDDSLGNEYITDYRYHDGYYDPVEKQFRGFARVEQVDLGDDTAPTLVTRSHFDTGADTEALKGKLLRLTVEQEDGNAFSDEVTAWDTRRLFTGTDGKQVVYAFPTESTQEILELGQGAPVTLKSEFEYDDFGNQTLNAEFGIDGGGYADERVKVAEFARNLTDWLVRYPRRVEVQDGAGNIISRTETFYDDENFNGNNFGLVFKGNATLVREWTDPADPGAFIQSQRTHYDEYGNPTGLLDPLAGSLNDGNGHSREIVYDDRFFTYPEQEIIHVGNGSPDLVMAVAYDEGFGTVVNSTDFNGNATTYGYDVFARIINTVRPGDTAQSPTVEYGYTLAEPVAGGRLINYVETRLLDGAVGSRQYFTSRTFIDGLGREVMSKEEAEDGRYAVKGAVTFNARREVAVALQPFFSDSFNFEDVTASGWSGSFHENGALATLGLAGAHATAFTYDATLREIRATNPDDTIRETVYEPLITRSYDENDTDAASPYYETPMVHHNDGLGRLARVDEVIKLNDDGTPANSIQTWTTRYAYRADDVLTRITDSQNNQKWMDYDGLGRKVFMNDMDRGTMNYGYDAASNLRETLDAKGQRIVYTYDGVNRLLTEDYQDNGTEASFNRAIDVAYHYDAPAGPLDLGNGGSDTATQTKGFLAWVQDLSGEEHMAYDARGRVRWTVKRIPDPVSGVMESFKTEMAYDSLDRVTSLIYPDEDRAAYHYNARNLLERIGGGAAHNLSGNPNIIGGIDYAPSGQLLRTDYGNGVRTAYAYDRRLRMNNFHTAPASAPANPLIAYTYYFDGVSNITRIDDRRPGTERPAGDPRRNTQVFEYDDLYRLINVQYSFNLPGAALRDDGQIAYRYDRIGNMLSKTSGIDQEENGLSVTNIGAMSYGGNLGASGRVGRNSGEAPGPHALTGADNGEDERIYPYDANGNMTDIDGLECTWDFKDRLRFVENDEMRAEYIYDYTDRRIVKKVWDKGGLAPPKKIADEAGATDTTFSDDIGKVAKTAVPVPSASKQSSDTPSLTTQYINRYFEIREYEQPTKYVWNGETRVVKVTGSLNGTAPRVQRFRVHQGWNLVALLVEADDAAGQLGIGNGKQLAAAFRWNAGEKTFAAIDGGDPLPAGSILWLNVQFDGVLRVKGTYGGTLPQTLTGTGDFIHSGGLYTKELMEGLMGYGKTVWQPEPNAGEEVWELLQGLQVAADTMERVVLEPGRPFFVQGVTDLELGGGATKRIVYYHQDHLGSSNVLAASDGGLEAENVFFAYGTPRETTSDRKLRGSSYLFTQKERDLESGLQYFEVRFLYGITGRFNRVDPLRTNFIEPCLSNPQKINIYAYCLNRPVNLYDPSGCSEDEVLDQFGTDGYGASSEPTLDEEIDTLRKQIAEETANQDFRRYANGIGNSEIVLDVYLPKNRNTSGVLRVLLNGDPVAEFEVLGRGSRGPGDTQFQNKGNTPSGEYAGSTPIETKDWNERSYGSGGALRLSPVSGNSKIAEQAFGREGLLIHGGSKGGQNYWRGQDALRATHGCLRLSNDDLHTLRAIVESNVSQSSRNAVTVKITE